MASIARSDITGLVLAGGLATRMGGLDKGLQCFAGIPLALHSLQRLQPQVGTAALNANRNLQAYARFGVPVWPDANTQFDGPLAGFMAGLTHCSTPWLATVPCDTPLFPPDLVARLAAALAASDAQLAMAYAPERLPNGQLVLRPQPVCCLLARKLLPSLQAYTEAGGRRVGAWAHQQRLLAVHFDAPGDDPSAFSNTNTLAELQALQSPAPP